MINVNKVLKLFGLKVVRTGRESASRYPDFTPEEKELIRTVQPYTMTSPERIYALVEAVRYVVRHQVPGAFVECGVWRGGSMMAAARTLRSLGAEDRDLFLFDTFEGMTPPTSQDVAFDGQPARERLGQDEKVDAHGSAWCYAQQEEVEHVMHRTGYPQRRVHLVKGPVEETLPGHAPERIALLRLDTDWFESTRHEMEHLFPLLSPGGVLILDDYGHWKGARKAVDEYIDRHDVRILLGRIDYTGRMGVKP